MKNTIAILVIFAIIVLGFLFLNKDVKNMDEEQLETSETESMEEVTESEEVGTSTENETSPQTNNPIPTTNYTYENSELGFAINYPGLVVTEKENTSPVYTARIFTVGVGDQTNVPEEDRIPNKMAIYIWDNEEGLSDLKAIGENQGQTTVRGIVFDKYFFPSEDGGVFHFITEKDGLFYDVGVRAESDLSKFYLL